MPLRNRTPSPLTQVAAVCYRPVGSSARFLLVRTSSGKWTFPKGRQEPVYSQAEVAAIEAREEAGVTGHVDQEPFGTYIHRKRSIRSWDGEDVLVLAFLLRVHRVSQPAEAHRTPRWFTANEAKQRLALHRPPRYHARLHRVIDRALRLIEDREAVRMSFRSTLVPTG